MVGQGRVRNVEFFLNLADNQAVRVRGQKQLHDAKAGSVPIAENMSAYLTILSMEVLREWFVFRYLQKYHIKSRKRWKGRYLSAASC